MENAAPYSWSVLIILELHYNTSTCTFIAQTTHLQVEGSITDEPSYLHHVQVKGRFVFIGRK